jgi:hypothetical protein
MTSYTCTIKFLDATKTKVGVGFTPELPGVGLLKGDQVTFTSADGPWQVKYQKSPFDAQENTLLIKGAKGGQQHFAIAGTGGSHPFLCAITVGNHEVGWNSAGGDTPIKTT